VFYYAGLPRLQLEPKHHAISKQGFLHEAGQGEDPDEETHLSASKLIVSRLHILDTPS